MILITIVFGVTIYDTFNNLNSLRLSIDDQLKPVESFIVTQALVNNIQSINVEINNLNQGDSGYQFTWNPYEAPKFLIIKWRPPFSWIYDYSLGEIGGYQFGYLRVTGSFLTDKVIIYNFSFRFFLLMVFILNVLIFLMPLSKKIPEALFISPINRFLNLVSSSNLKNVEYSLDFPAELKQLEKKIIDLLERAQEHERHKAAIEIGYIAAQLAHDLHSPLVSLQSFIQEKAAKFSERDRDFLRTSLRRLNDITISLLSKYKFSLQTPASKQGHVFIVACILEVMNEKRIHFLERKIEIVFHTIKEIDNFAIAYINPSELKRALSNLLNNAVNAMKVIGTIEITFEDTFLGGCITIKDHGIGMSLERINDLLSSHPSEAAKIGLGLQHAKKYFDEINGKLSIDSEEGSGTTVSISLPCSQIPDWLITSFQTDDRPVIIIDDDRIIHDVWKRKFNKSKEIKLLHFTKPEEFLIFCAENKEAGTIFCDYEFLNSDLNGLDLLKQISTSYLKILVTSHYNEESIVKICDENKFKLLPKRLVPYFSIENQILKNPQEIYLIHIDNDKQCIHSWEYFAKNENINIASYFCPQEFLRFQEKFPRNIPIYIDNDLQLEKSGIEYAEEIYQLGFKKIFLSTGSREINIENYPWITKVVDKQAPFIN